MCISKIKQGYNWCKKKIIWCLVAFGLICYGATSIPEKIPADLQLKVAKEQIMASKIENGVATYFYQGDLIQSEPNEIVSKRTYNARFYETGKPNKVSATYSVGAPYYKNEKNEWRHLLSATTTEDSFKKQIEVSFLDRLLGKQALADIIDLQVGLGTDDCFTHSGYSAIYLTAGYMTLDGIAAGGINYHDYMRFQNVTVPNGATIDHAYINIRAYGNYTGTSYFNISGIDEDNTATFSTYANVEARTTTTADIDWTAGNWDWNQQYGYTNDPQDIASVIAEITSRPGWVSGNSLAIKMIHTARSMDRAGATIETGGGYQPPQLHIEYTTGEAAPQPLLPEMF